MIPGPSLLFRQVNPNWIRNGRVTSQVFQPTPKDQKKLSVYDGRKITAEDSYLHYTGKLGLASVGVMAVTVLECQQRDLVVTPEPKPCFPEHTIIDFSTHSNSTTKTKAKDLTAAAKVRGWQYNALAS
jgi:hypothetical protein